MKQILFFIGSLFLFISAFAQDYKKQPSLGINFTLTDFQMASDIRKNGVSYLINNRQILLGKNLNPGLSISYTSGISRHIDFLATLGGSFLRYQFQTQPPPFSNFFLLESTAGINAKLISDKYLVVPFFHIALGASKYQNYYAAFIPAGVGLQIKLSDEAFIILSSDYRIPVTETASYHFYHSIGFIGNIIKKK